MEVDEQFEELAKIEDYLRQALRGEHMSDKNRDLVDRALYIVEGLIEENSKHW